MSRKAGGLRACSSGERPSISGGIDTLVCNAGYGSVRTVAETSHDEMRRMFETNVFGTTDCIHAAVPIMRKQELRDGWRGQIMIVSSAAAKRGLPFFGPYSATKAAQLSIAEALRVELKADRIAVTSVHPVGTNTEFFDTAEKQTGLRRPTTDTKVRQSAQYRGAENGPGDRTPDDRNVAAAGVAVGAESSGVCAGADGSGDVALPSSDRRAQSRINREIEPDMSELTHPVAAIVLAGGLSRRMGWIKTAGNSARPAAAGACAGSTGGIEMRCRRSSWSLDIRPISCSRFWRSARSWLRTIPISRMGKCSRRSRLDCGQFRAKRKPFCWRCAISRW